MGENMNDDANLMRQQRQFIDQLDHTIHATNREVIHAVLPRLDKATFAKMARTVANLRIKYVAAAVQLAGQEPFSPQQVAQLKQLREQFDEAKSAFDAVKRVIIRGYVDLAD